MKKLKALSFFSGAMGMDIGLEKAGIDVTLACESEKFINDEQYAKSNNLGLWKTKFEYPWNNRKN